MGYSVPKEGTATCQVCGEKFKSWKRDPMNPCIYCGSYAVVWSAEIYRDGLSQEQMAEQWMRDQRAAREESE